MPQLVLVENLRLLLSQIAVHIGSHRADVRRRTGGHKGWRAPAIGSNILGACLWLSGLHGPAHVETPLPQNFSSPGQLSLFGVAPVAKIMEWD